MICLFYPIDQNLCSSVESFYYSALNTFLGRNHIQDDMFIHCEATLPLGIVGSLKPILVPTLKLTSTFARRLISMQPEESFTHLHYPLSTP